VNYGTISVKTIMIAGKIAHSLIIHDESLEVRDEIEAAEVFYGLLEQLKHGELINPGVQVEVDPNTRRIRRVVKSWTEVK
jgi:hypothetical protein